MWLYNFPNWLVGVICVTVLTGAALGGHRLWRRFSTLKYSPENSGFALAVLQVVALVLSLLLAFSSVSVWEAHTSAESATATEASVSGQLVRDLAIYGGPASASAREAVRDYIQSVISEDWPAMAKGGYSLTAAHKFNTIFRKVALIEPRTPRAETLFAEILSKADELNVARRSRLGAAGRSSIPVPLWGTILFGILFNFLLFYLLPVSRLNDWMLGLYAGMLGLMLFFLIVMDYPFAGSLRLSTYPYQSALQSMQFWDAETPALPAAAASGKKSAKS